MLAVVPPRALGRPPHGARSGPDTLTGVISIRADPRPMLCPWCMHYGSDDAEYVFDEDLYCGICAQPMPRGQDQWFRAYREMDPAWFEHIERELNHIISSRSGLPPEMREAIGRAIDAYRDKRVGTAPLPITEDEYANWYKFACTYFAPGSGVQR